MKKRLLSLLLCVAMLVSLFCGLTVTASAEDVTNQAWGDNITWSYVESTGTLTVNGTGAIGTSSSYTGSYPWNSIRSSVKSLVIGDGITSIESYAFRGMTALTSVNLGSAVEKIGLFAFVGCTALETVNIPASVTQIGDVEANSYYGGNPFYDCTALTTFTVANDNTVYKAVDGVIYSKDGTTLYVCPAGKTGTFSVGEEVTTIGNTAFRSCQLTEIVVPGTVTSFGEYWTLGCNATIVDQKATIHWGTNGETLYIKSSEITPADVGAEALPEGWKSGTLVTFDINQGYYNSYNSSITAVTILDKVQPVGNCTWFYNLSKLKTITGIDKLDTSELTNMSNMFYYCSALTSLDVSEFDTSNVTNMSNMFYGCRALQELDVSSWNTSNVTKMDGMFFNCNSLKTLDVSKWNTENVTSMSLVFYYCYSLETLNVSNWNTSNVTNMRGMFQSCGKVKELNVSNWNTSNVTNMSSIFDSCGKVEELDVSNWNTSNVTSMRRMFTGCNAITSLDLSSFDTSNVTDMNLMFYYCQSLKELNLSSFETSNVTDMTQMFYDCCATSIDISSFDLSNVTNASSILAGSKATEITVAGDITITAEEGTTVAKTVTIAASKTSPATITVTGDATVTTSSGAVVTAAEDGNIVVSGTSVSIPEGSTITTKNADGVTSTVETKGTLDISNENVADDGTLSIPATAVASVTVQDGENEAVVVTMPADADENAVVALSGSSSSNTTTIPEGSTITTTNEAGVTSTVETKGTVALTSDVTNDAGEIALPAASVASVTVGEGENAVTITVPDDATGKVTVSSTSTTIPEGSVITTYNEDGSVASAVTTKGDVELTDVTNDAGEIALPAESVASVTVGEGENAVTITVPDDATDKVTVSSTSTTIPDGSTYTGTDGETYTLTSTTTGEGAEAVTTPVTINTVSTNDDGTKTSSQISATVKDASGEVDDHTQTTEETTNYKAATTTEEGSYDLTVTCDKCGMIISTEHVTIAKLPSNAAEEAVADDQTFNEGKDTTINATSAAGKSDCTTVTFSATNVNAMETTDGSTITVKTDVGNVTFDAAAIAYLKDKAGTTHGISITVQNQGTNRSSLTNAQKTAAANGEVIELSLTLDDGTVIFTDGNAAGKATVKLPYTAVNGVIPAIYYLATDGTLTDMNATYDEDEKVMTFETEHFSDYLWKEVDKTEYTLSVKAAEKYPDGTAVVCESDGTPNYNVGDTFTVDVYANTDSDKTASVQSIQFRLYYNSEYVKLENLDWALTDEDGNAVTNGLTTFNNNSDSSNCGRIGWAKTDTSAVVAKSGDTSDAAKIATVTFRVLKDNITKGTSLVDTDATQITIYANTDAKIVADGCSDSETPCTIGDALKTRLHNLTVNFKNDGTDMKEAETFVKYGQKGYYTDEDRTATYTVPTPKSIGKYVVASPMWRDAAGKTYENSAAVEKLTFTKSDTLTVRTEGNNTEYVKVTHDGIDGVADTAKKGQNFTFTPEIEGYIITDIHVTIDGADYTVQDNGDGSYTIPKADITGPIVITADTIKGTLEFIYNDDESNNVSATYEDAKTSTGYVALPAADTAAYKIAFLKTDRLNGKTYQIGTTDCYWSTEYNAYVAIVSDSLNSATIAKSITVANQDTVNITYGDVNGTSGIDTQDAALIEAMMHQSLSAKNYLGRLAADYDGDMTVTVKDATAVMLKWTKG